jgi:hypothetical protein
MESLLAKYEAAAKFKSDDELRFIIRDIKECWAANVDWQKTDHPYGEKLWAEWDAVTVELQKRLN